MLSHRWQCQAWLLPLRVSGSARVVIPSPGLTQHGVYWSHFFTWWYSRKWQVSVRKISQCPREVTSPTSHFQGAQATAILLLVYRESNWPLLCFAICFPLGYPLACLFSFLTVGRFFVYILSISSLFMLRAFNRGSGCSVIYTFSLKRLCRQCLV